jgi:phospholipid transport system transporter-binding protein
MQMGKGSQNKVAKTSKAAEQGRPVKLGRDLRIASASATFQALRDAAGGADGKVVLDARLVEKADAAGLQALLAGRQALLQAGKSIAWTGCTPHLKAAAGMLGLAEALGLPE